MDDIANISILDPSRPTWENMVESPIIEQVPLKYKLKLRYGGFFRLVKNSNRKKYCFGSQKSIYMETGSYNLDQLIEEVKNRYPSKSELVLSIVFVDKYAKEQSFIELDSNENFMVMLSMYQNEKEVTIFVMTDNTIQQSGHHEANDEPKEDNDSDSCPSVESYHSLHSIDNEGENYSYTKENPTMKMNSKFRNVVAFRRALNHYSLVHEFEYVTERSDLTRSTAYCADSKCNWKIHASVTEDKVIEVKKLVDTHTCIRSNMCGSKRATQGWVAEVVTEKLKSDGDIPPAKLQKWIMQVYNVQELRNRNLGSVVDIEFERKEDKKHFQRFFICLVTCSQGFLVGCRPYIALDACHLKGKFNGVLAAATSIDSNNGIYPVTYGVLESENTRSCTWFLNSLKKAIGTPIGLAISSDMQKGLEIANNQVYPTAEHRECMRHLYSNFKKHFRGDFFNSNLWGAARTYNINEHDILLNEIANVREEAIKYLNENHNKIWSQSKFGTTAKCDYITNNISETFNSWIGDERYHPVLDLLDAIREKIMIRFDEKRKIVNKWKGTLVPKVKKYLSNIYKNLGAFEVYRSSNNRAEVKYKGKRWEVILDERKCTCRVWQVKGVPCVHAAAFIAFIRDANWETYVDPFFTIDKYKEAYALEVATMPGKDQWVSIESEEKIHPTIIKRPPGRPRKNRIIPPNEPKRRHKCPRCSEYGHHEKTCKNSAHGVSASQSSQSSSLNQASISTRGHRNTTTIPKNKKAKSNQF